jgi:ketosteroid isomerase-like protein
MGNWTATILMLVLAAPALADPTATARAHDEAFAQACEAGDVKGVVALYADDAVVVWPGAGEEARGKSQIEKLAAVLCDP